MKKTAKAQRDRQQAATHHRHEQARQYWPLREAAKAARIEKEKILYRLGHAIGHMLFIWPVRFCMFWRSGFLNQRFIGRVHPVRKNNNRTARQLERAARRRAYKKACNK